MDLLADEVKVLVTAGSVSTGGLLLSEELEVQQRFAFAGNGTIDGIITVAGVPSRRLVRVIDRKSGTLIAETFSDPITGAYIFTSLDPLLKYLVYSLDDTPIVYNAVVADQITPVVP